MSKKNKGKKAEETETTTATETAAETAAVSEAPEAAAGEAQAAQETPATETAEKPAKKPREKKEKAPKEPKPPRQKKEKPAREVPAHMSKVAAAAASLPSLEGDALGVFEAAKELSTGDLNKLSAHLAVEARRRATLPPEGRTLNVGDTVRIVSGSQAKYIGLVATVTEVRRIRVFVKADSVQRPIYLFAGDVELVSSAVVNVTDEPVAKAS
jgi:hypothetical protein